MLTAHCQLSCKETLHQKDYEVFYVESILTLLVRNNSSLCLKTKREVRFFLAFCYLPQFLTPTKTL